MSTPNAIDQWLIQYMMERLTDILQASSHGPDTTVRMFGHRDLTNIDLLCGRKLNIADPAVAHLINYVRAASESSRITLDAMMKVLQGDFLVVTDGRPKRPIDDLRRMFDLRQAGQWGELDNFIRTVTRQRQSLSEIIGPMVDSFRVDPQDFALGEKECFVVGHYVTGRNYEKVAFGSSPEVVLRYVDDAIQDAGHAYKRDSLVRSWLALLRNEQILFCTPLLPKLTTTKYPCPYKGFTISTNKNHALLAADWANTKWYDQDPRLMGALANALPRCERALLKGRYLEDDLGI